MLLSAVSVLVVAQSSSEIPEGLMNKPLYSHYLSLSSLSVQYTIFNIFYTSFISWQWYFFNEF